MSQIQNAGNVSIYAIPKAKDPPSDALARFLSKYTSFPKVATLTKDNSTRKFIQEWNTTLDTANQKPTLVDAAPALSAFMAVKDADELAAVDITAQLSSTLLSYQVAPKLELILDKESKISHESLSTQIEACLGSGEGTTAKGPDLRVWEKGPKSLSSIDWMFVEFCYSPLVISCSNKSPTAYELKYNASSTLDNITDPNPEYALLIALQAMLLPQLKDGVLTKDAYAAAPMKARLQSRCGFQPTALLYPS